MSGKSINPKKLYYMFIIFIILLVLTFFWNLYRQHRYQERLISQNTNQIISNSNQTIMAANNADQGQSTTTQTYTNQTLHYTFTYPADWFLDTTGLNNSVNQKVEVYPKKASLQEPGMPTYFEVHLDDRDLNYLLTQVFNQMNRLDRQLAGQEAYQFIPQNEKNTAWIIIPHQDLIYMITTTQSNLDEVQAILASFKFI